MTRLLPAGAVLALALACAHSSRSEEILVEDFGTDPVGGRAVPTGDASTFSHSPGELTAAIDVIEPHARLAWPLARCLTEADSFAAAIDFELRNVNFPADNFCQLSMGFINTANTGAVRTSSPGDCWELLNIDYFPGAGFPTWAPTFILRQPDGATDALTGATLKSPFGSESLINEAGEIGTVPENVPLTATLEYDAQTRTILTSLSGPGGGLALNVVGTDADGDPSTVALALDEQFPFVFDAFALLQWNHFQGGSADIVVRSIRIEASPRDLLGEAFPDGLPEPQFAGGELSLGYTHFPSGNDLVVRAEHSPDLRTWSRVPWLIIPIGVNGERRTVAVTEGFLRIVVETSD